MINETGKLTPLSRYEVLKIRMRTKWIVWKEYNRDFRYPVLYRYGKKILKYINAQL